MVAAIAPHHDSVVDFVGLSKEFTARNKQPVQALHEVSLKVRPGIITGLVGADGAGKTTMIRIAAGLLVPTEGSASVLGMDSLRDTIDIQSAIGYMPQKFGLYQDLSVAENMELYADLQGVPVSQRKSRYERLLTMTNLGRYTKRRAGDLSGGMKQKLGLACALVKSPRVLLLDEPTVGVDPVSRRELWIIVNELVRQDGIGVLVSTAYLDEAEKCDHIVVLHQGRILAEGSSQHFTKRVLEQVALVYPETPEQCRPLYSLLTRDEAVIDATIRSGRIRVVLESADTDLDTIIREFGARAEKVEPNFEDAFMAMIPREEHHFSSHGQDNGSPPAIGGNGSEKVVFTEGLGKMFGSFEAVKNLSFSVRKGEIFGLLGPNGAGKSTTFRMLCGLLPASSGSLSVAGYDLRRSRARARTKLGYMAQQFSLYGQLTVRENLTFFGKAYGVRGKKLRQRMDWAYQEFSLDAWQDKPAQALPGGYKQRLAMATALLHEPDILFLDEPTSGVDPFARREFWLRINGFAQQGVTVVVTTHFMEEAEYCDRMLIMSQGQTLATGSPAEIRALARTLDNPNPSMDDAFIALAENGLSREDEKK